MCNHVAGGSTFKNKPFKEIAVQNPTSRRRSAAALVAKTGKSRASDDSDGRTGGGSFDRVKSWSFQSRSRGSIRRVSASRAALIAQGDSVRDAADGKNAVGKVSPACVRQRRVTRSVLSGSRPPSLHPVILRIDLFLFCFEQNQSLVGPPRDFARNTCTPSPLMDSLFFFFSSNGFE